MLPSPLSLSCFPIAFSHSPSIKNYVGISWLRNGSTTWHVHGSLYTIASRYTRWLHNNDPSKNIFSSRHLSNRQRATVLKLYTNYTFLL